MDWPNVDVIPAESRLDVGPYADKNGAQPHVVYGDYSQPLIKARKRQMYNSQEWERIKPIFTKLYIDQEMTLQQVMVELARTHKFCATYVHHSNVEKIC